MTAWLRCAFHVGVVVFSLHQACAGVIAGRVSLPHGRTVAEVVRVRLLTAGGEEKQAVFSDTAGSFRFSSVSAGDYVVTVETAGFRLSQVRLSVPSGRDVQQRLLIELRPISRASETGIVRSADLQAGNSAQKHFKKGLELAGKHRWENSAAEFGKALAKAPGFFSAALHRGVVLAKIGRTTEARSQLRNAIALCARCPEAYVALSKLEEGDGKPSQALAVLLEGQQRLPRSHAILLEACRIQFENNNADAAQELCRMAHETGGGLAPEAHLLLAKIYHARRMEPQVAQELKIYLAEAPDSEIARLIRERLGN